MSIEPSADVPSGDHSLVEVPQSSEFNTHTREGVPQVLTSEAVWSLLDPLPDEDSQITHPISKSSEKKTLKDLVVGFTDEIP